MDRKIAERVKELRIGDVIHSWRRLSEIICEEFPHYPVECGWESAEAASGNQLHGIDLCREAAEVLGEDVAVWEDIIHKALNPEEEGA